MRLFRLALEENSDGKFFKEIEYEYYCRITDLSQLDNASSKEAHEQWEIKIPKADDNVGEGRIRVRKTTFADGRIEYVQTTKSILKKDNARIEVPILTTEDGFKQFMILSNAGMIKDRYCFNSGDFVFEVDMFKKPDGSYCEWCKIDIEVPTADTVIPELPIVVENLITNQKYKRTPEEIELLDKLYETEFLTKNPYLRE